MPSKKAKESLVCSPVTMNVYVLVPTAHEGWSCGRERKGLCDGFGIGAVSDMVALMFLCIGQPGSGPGAQSRAQDRAISGVDSDGASMSACSGWNSTCSKPPCGSV